MSYHLSVGGNEKRAFAQKLAKHDAVEMRRQVASAASSTVSFSSTRDARTIAGVTGSPGASTCCGDVTDPADFEEFLESHQLELSSDELRDLLDAPPDDIDVGIVQRRYRTVRPLAPDKHEIGSLDLHVQECVRHYLSDWVYALRRYAEFGSAGIHQRAQETPVPTGGELHQEYEVDGVVEFSISNGANKTPSSSARSSWLMADTPRGSWASSHFDLKNSAADALLPSLLDRVPAETLDRLNQARRQQTRQSSLLALYPPQEEEDVIERRAIPPLPAEHRGHRILVKCLQLKLEVAIEPIFASMALYDAGRKKKISENFYFDMNSEQMKNMLRAHVPYVDFSTLSKSCIFDITYPSSDIFLVIKLEKVMQGDINECTELYLRDDKTREKAEKAHAQAATFCERLGQYRMPFAWTAIYLMNILDGISSLEREAGDKDTSSGQSNSLERKSSQSSFDQFRRSRPGAGEGGSGSSGSGSGLGRRGSLERRSFSERRPVSAAQLGQSLQTFRPVTLTVSSFFRQESDRLKEEDLFKHLQDLKRPSSAMKKLKCIGGTLKLDISPCPEEVKHCLTPELAKLRPYTAALEEFDEYDKSRPCKEMLEFPSQDVYEPHYLYRNILFVSPRTVNFVNYPNKPGISARNITVRVQFLNGEGKDAALPVIFGRSTMPEFVSEAYTAISYHTKNPDFYDEIKIKLPANLTDAHHLLFTFFHVSCQQRKAEPNSVATPIGYTWLPVFREGRLNTTEACLPVLLEPPPPNYPYITPDINLPGVKWVDNHRPLFTVSVTAETSVHAQDKNIDSFLCLCRIVESGVVPPRIGESNVEMELNRSIQQLSESNPERLVRLLPLLLDRLLLLMVRPPMVAGQVINTGQPCFQAIGQLVQRVSDLLDWRNDQHGRNALLMSYVRYQCGLPQGSAEHPSAPGMSPPRSPAYVGRTSSLPRARTFSRSTSNPNMAAPLDVDSEVGQILGRALDRTASLRTGVSQELLVPSRTATTRKVVHEELALQWVVASGKSRELALANPWFFFELMFKSMLCTLASSGRLEAPRRYRFSDRFTDDIGTLVETITKDIVTRQARESREVPRERPATPEPPITPRPLRSPKRSSTLPTRQPRPPRGRGREPRLPGSPVLTGSPLRSPPPTAGDDSRLPCPLDVSRLNAGLAFFINDLLSVMDRSFVLGLVRLYCKELTSRRAVSADATQLTHLKLDFLRIVCSHEHYFSLNLPFGTPLSGAQPASSPTPSVGSASSQSSYLSTLVANERPRFAELSGEFRQQHYLAGLVLAELEMVLPRSNPGTHGRAVGVVRSLLAWHDADPRFQEPAARARVALLYLPLVPIVLDNLDQVFDWSSRGRSSGYLSREDGPPGSPPALNGGRDSDAAAEAQLDSMTSTITPDSAIYARLTGIRPETSRDLLICALWVLKNVRTDVLRATWAEYKPVRIQQLLRLLHTAVSCFEYRGRRQSPLASQPSLRGSTRAVEAKSRLEDMILGAGSARSELMRRRSQHQHASPAPAVPSSVPPAAAAGAATPDRLRWRKEQTAAQWRLDDRPGGRSELSEPADPATERSLAAEASMVILDALETIIQVLSSQDGLHGLLGMAFRVLLHALSCNQSTAVVANMFATQRSLVTKYPALLFDEETEHCADLCLRLLEHCSSAVSNTRSQASASLYLLMRQNFEIGNNFARVKMQVTMSLSSLVGTSQNFNEGYLRRSLKTILEYAENDQELAETTFPGQVSDLVFNLHMILSDTVKMKEFQEDHEMLLDLMYRIAKGYQNSPDLRLTWLDNMAKKHMERAQYAEAGMCYVHSAALVSEYLSMLEPKSYLPLGAAAFENLSPNVLEESAVSDDVVSPDEEGICTGKSFTEAGLVSLLDQAVNAFDVATMHEAVNDVYKLLIPIHENSRDYRRLSVIHGKLQDSFSKVISADGKRMFWSHFRVGFYGFKFGDLNGEEFLYKEPALTKLAEISNRLESFYSDRFGASNVHTIKGSNKVDPAKLDPETAYIQITYVEPYFDMWERRTRVTAFERNFNVKTFMFATPYTLDGRAHGELHEQYKRKTILTVANSFPYVKTRVPIVSRREVVLTPIEVAIEDIRKKTAELSAAVQQNPPDTKILQMVLQGCIGTTVNQGPMEVANVFLSELFLGQEPTDLQNKLRICFRDFSKKCMDALKKNRSLIKPDQHEYQKELEKNYQRFTEKLKPMFSSRQAQTLTLSKSRSRELMPAPHLKTSPFV